MRAGGALSCAAVTRQVKHTPSPNPRNIGYAHVAVVLDSVVVAMSTTRQLTPPRKDRCTTYC
jgi:hypothetical protein